MGLPRSRTKTPEVEILLRRNRYVRHRNGGMGTRILRGGKAEERRLDALGSRWQLPFWQQGSLPKPLIPLPPRVPFPFNPHYLNLPSFSSVPSLKGFWFLGQLPRSCPPSEQKVGEEGLLLRLCHLPYLLPGNPGGRRLVLCCVRSWAA